jgi:trans-aconitate methyltransferase
MKRHNKDCHRSSSKEKSKVEDEGSDIDWDRFWDDPTDIDEMVDGARRMADRLRTFMTLNPPSTVADFGCGPALTLFHLATEMPSVVYTGFDDSSGIVVQNTKRAEEMGLKNLRFKKDTLPILSTDRLFDLVICIATLHYVKDIRAGIQALYERVAPGGHLIFNYPNKFTQASYRRWAMDGGPERFDRFELVIQGDNLLTVREIGQLLGKRPQSFWTLVGEEGSRDNVCLAIRK